MAHSYRMRMAWLPRCCTPGSGQGDGAGSVQGQQCSMLDSQDCTGPAAAVRRTQDAHVDAGATGQEHSITQEVERPRQSIEHNGCHQVLEGFAGEHVAPGGVWRCEAWLASKQGLVLLPGRPWKPAEVLATESAKQPVREEVTPVCHPGQSTVPVHRQADWRAPVQGSVALVNGAHALSCLHRSTIAGRTLGPV